MDDDPALYLPDGALDLILPLILRLGIGADEVVLRGLRLLHEHTVRPGYRAPPGDPWTPVPVHVVYRETQVTGEFLPATHRVKITSGPLAGTKYKSPSGAARAVVAALNPGRAQAQGNGWKFWWVTDHGVRLDVYRKKSGPTP
jgi:hypothetical protein